MTRPEAARDLEGGFTLAEVLGALLILSIAVITIISAIGTSIIASDVQRKLVTEDAVVRAYAEALNAAAYVDCATSTTGGYSAATVLPNRATKWPGYDIGIVQLDPDTTHYWNSPTADGVAYWNGDNPATYSASCTAGADKGVQRLVLQAHLTVANRGVQRLEIVKRRP
jgi:type II secretory pathway pseudopilin PulG